MQMVDRPANGLYGGSALSRGLGSESPPLE